MMTNAAAAKFRSIFIRIAQEQGFSEYAEDLAHDALVKWVAKDGNQLPIHAVIDAIRLNFGRLENPTHEMRAALELKTVGLKDYILTRFVPTRTNQLLEFESTIAPLKGQHRSVVYLHFVWGLSNAEIGAVFGFSESRSCQLKEEALRLLQVLVSEESSTTAENKE